MATRINITGKRVNFRRAKKKPAPPPRRRLEEIAPKFVAEREAEAAKFPHTRRTLSRLPENQLGKIGRQLAGLDAPPRAAAASKPRSRSRFSRDDLIRAATLRAQREEIDDPNF